MTQASDIVAELDRLYTASVARLQAGADRLSHLRHDARSRARTDGSFAYPEIRLTYRGDDDRPAPLRSFGRLVEPGDYRISVTKPAIFADYLTEQLDAADRGLRRHGRRRCRGGRKSPSLMCSIPATR